MQIWSLFYQKEMQFTKWKNEIKILLNDLEEEVENLKKEKRKFFFVFFYIYNIHFFEQKT